MLKQTLKQSWRSLLKQKQSTTINIVGLVVAVTLLLIIQSWVRYEKSYDRFHEKADRIYRVSFETGSVEGGNHWHFARSWQTWRRELPNYHPEIEAMAEMAPTFNTVVRIGDHVFYERGFSIKPQALDVFDFEFVMGDPATSLSGEHKVVISESMAEIYFGAENPLGKTVSMDGSYIDKEFDYTISGVFKDIPKNSHFQTNFLVSYTEPKGTNPTEWAYTYLLLKDGASIDQIHEQANGFIETHVPEGEQKNLKAIHFTPLTDIHLKSNIEREIQTNGDIRHVRLLTGISIGVFIIALINFVNLLTVSFGKRVLNFNINRLMGGGDRYNIWQLVAEAGAMAMASIGLSLLLYKPAIMLLQKAGLFSGAVPNHNLWHFTLLSLIVFIVIAIVGTLPYFLLKIKTVRGNLHQALSPASKNLGLFNKPLLVLQFAISIMVIIGSLVLKKQNDYIFSQSKGYGDENIIMVDRNFWSEEREMMLFKNELDKNPAVMDYCATFQPPTHLNKDARQVKSSRIPGGFTDYAMAIFVTDHSLFHFFGHPIIAGRTMKPYIEGQCFEEYVVNESAVKKMGFQSPQEVIGMDFTVKPFFPDIIKGGRIVGVVKDFTYTSLYHPIQPTVFFQKPIWQWYFLIKLAPGSFENNIASIQQDWKEIYPEFPFEYEMLTDVYNKAYGKDVAIFNLLNIFSVLCIVLSSIGLLGITSILLLNKTKEIGIRKVNGAKVWEVVAMLNKSFMLWVLAAFLLAAPVSHYAMQKWLENFTYKTHLSWWIFALAGAGSLAISLLTVSLQSWKAANKNPVESLKHE
jgi:putative ABC transport system permease protein